MHWSEEPRAQASASGGSQAEQMPSLMDLDIQPQAEAGASDPSSWHDWTVQEEKWREANEKLAAEIEHLKKTLGRSSSATVIPGADRPKELRAVYKYVTTRDSLQGNVATPAIQAYYPTLSPGQQGTLSSQALTMIADYHMTCVIRGPSLISPIPSREIEEKLPPLMDYALPQGAGITDVRVADSRAQSLRVAVWLHRLDMALSPEKEASGSLVSSRHTQGGLLSYFLALDTGNVTYERVLSQVLKENHRALWRKQDHLTSAIQKCNSRQTKYLDELSGLSKRLDSSGSDQLRGDLEARIAVVGSGLTKTKEAIERFKNRLEECRLMELEAWNEDWTRPLDQAPDDVRVEIPMEESESSTSSSNDPDDPEVQPPEQADAEGAQVAPPEGNLAVTPEEEKILIGDETPQTGDGQATETASVTGDLARMQVNSPPHEQPEDGDTPMETSPPLSHPTEDA